MSKELRNAVERVEAARMVLRSVQMRNISGLDPNARIAASHDLHFAEVGFRTACKELDRVKQSLEN